MKKSLKDKWALVTGSSRGIGQQIALGLGELGCNVIIHGRTLDSTRTTEQLFKDRKFPYQLVSGKLDSEESIDSIITAVRNITPQLDILYNNAAIPCESTPVFDFPMSEWLKSFQVNLFAMVQLCSAFAPGMKERNWGRIVNVSSGICDQPQLAPYSVSKAAVDKWTRDLAFEFKDTAVRVNAIDPGWIRTDLGGPDAWEAVETVLPGMLAPILVNDNGPNGEYFAAQHYKFFE